MNKNAFFLLSLLYLPLVAVLPPLNQSIEEITSLLSSKVVKDTLPSSESIESIFLEEEEVVILTSHYEMILEVKKHIPSKPGPIRCEYLLKKLIKLDK